MSIRESKVIDLVATRPDSCEVRLVIADDLTWEDPDHLLLLQEKLDTYLAFVESGQLARMTDQKIPESPDVQVVVALKHAPTPEALAFFARATIVMRRAGMGVAWKIAGSA